VIRGQGGEQGTGEHALSSAFLEAVRLAVRAEPPGTGFMKFMLEPLIREFPEGLEMREFARASAGEIARLLEAGHREVRIRREADGSFRLLTGGATGTAEGGDRVPPPPGRPQS